MYREIKMQKKDFLHQFDISTERHGSNVHTRIMLYMPAVSATVAYRLTYMASAANCHARDLKVRSV